MLSRIANIFTVLTFGLLTVILGLSAVAIHDFNNPDLVGGNSHIFVREYERHANYEVGIRKGRLVGYQINYTVCGQPEGNYETLVYGNGIGEILKGAPPVFGYATRLGHFPGMSYQEISYDELESLGLNYASARGISEKEPFEYATSTRRVCQVNPAGIWKATGSLFHSLT